MAHPDLDALLNALLPFAQEMLTKHGEFLPFGASISKKGDRSVAAGDAGVERPESQVVIELLIDGFRGARRKLRAAGVCYDVLAVPPGEKRKTDAICARLEHEAGEAVSVFLPYKKGRRGKVDYGEIWGAPDERTIF
jgi:hypothetical protein